MKVEVSRDNKNLGAHQHSLKTERIHQTKQRQEQDVTKNMEVDKFFRKFKNLEINPPFI